MKRAFSAVLATGILAASGVTYAKYDEWFVFPDFHEIVAAPLLDPASAQFRNERISESGWMCGEVNSKNSSGGYVGYKRFVASLAGYVFIEDHGSVGKKDADSDYSELVAGLDAKTELTQRAIDRHAAGMGLRLPSNSDIQEEATRRIFEAKWAPICGTT